MLERIISKAKKKGARVVYAKDGQKFHIGDICFVTYRDQPSSARNTETYINQGSLCVWFPENGLLYTGDTGAYCVKKHDLHPTVVTEVVAVCISQSNRGGRKTIPLITGIVSTKFNGFAIGRLHQ